MALAGLLLLPGACLAQDAPPPPSQAAPPFWARPRPSGPECDCDAQTAATGTASSSRSRVFVAGLGSGIALVAVALYWRRRRSAEPEPPPLPPRVPLHPVPAAAGTGGLDPRAKAREEFQFTDPRTAAVELAEAEPEAESASAQAFYSEIATSLRAALRKDPARQDLRRKLLEIFAASKQAQEFVNLTHEYLNQNRGVRDNFWPQIATLGVELAPEHELFREWMAERTRPTPRRTLQMRRFHELKVDQGKLYAAQQQLVADFARLRADAGFQTTLRQLLADSVRRPAPLAASPELAYIADGAQIYIKREDRRRFHDDVMINALGQVLVAQRLGRKRIVTATRDGVAGHAVAAAAAKLRLECTVFLSEADLSHYYGRLLSLRRLGAQLRPLPAGNARDPVDPRRHALEAWLEDPAGSQYVSGLTAGAPPFPDMVREFLSTVGRETVDQMKQLTGHLPAAVVAGVADGHLGLGLLEGFLEHSAVQLYCVEDKSNAPGGASEGAATQGSRREHRWLRETGRVSYVVGDEQETLRIIEQFHATGETLYSASARSMAHARALARNLDRRSAVVVMLTNQEGADFRSARIDW